VAARPKEYAIEKNKVNIPRALAAMLAGMPLTHAAFNYDVRKSTLSDHWKASQAGAQRAAPGRPPVLGASLEHTIVDWIEARARLGWPPSKALILAQAKLAADRAKVPFRTATGLPGRNIVGILSRAFLAALTPRNVQAGFAKAGIWPFNPQAIPAASLSLEGSIAKSAAAAHQAETKKLEDAKARLLALPDDLRELFSLPRLQPAKKGKGRRKAAARALLVTSEGMVARLKAARTRKAPRLPPRNSARRSGLSELQRKRRPRLSRRLLAKARPLPLRCRKRALVLVVLPAVLLLPRSQWRPGLFELLVSVG
jgi:hypothetical protein